MRSLVWLAALIAVVGGARCPAGAGSNRADAKGQQGAPQTRVATKPTGPNKPTKPTKPTKPVNTADSTFVRAMAQLRAVALDTTLDSLARDTARKRVLHALGFTADSLERYARSLASDPNRATAVWHAIDDHARGGPPARP